MVPLIRPGAELPFREGMGHPELKHSMWYQFTPRVLVNIAIVGSSEASEMERGFPEKQEVIVAEM